jgi:hypothetical protein
MLSDGIQPLKKDIAPRTGSMAPEATTITTKYKRVTFARRQRLDSRGGDKSRREPPRKFPIDRLRKPTQVPRTKRVVSNATRDAGYDDFQFKIPALPVRRPKPVTQRTTPIADEIQVRIRRANVRSRKSRVAAKVDNEQVPRHNISKFSRLKRLVSAPLFRPLRIDLSQLCLVCWTTGCKYWSGLEDLGNPRTESGAFYCDPYSYWNYYDMHIGRSLLKARSDRNVDDLQLTEKELAATEQLLRGCGIIKTMDLACDEEIFSDSSDSSSESSSSSSSDVVLGSVCLVETVFSADYSEFRFVDRRESNVVRSEAEIARTELRIDHAEWDADDDSGHDLHCRERLSSSSSGDDDDDEQDP